MDDLGVVPFLGNLHWGFWNFRNCWIFVGKIEHPPMGVMGTKQDVKFDTQILLCNIMHVLISKDGKSLDLRSTSEGRDFSWEKQVLSSNRATIRNRGVTNTRECNRC